LRSGLQATHRDRQLKKVSNAPSTVTAATSGSAIEVRPGIASTPRTTVESPAKITDASFTLEARRRNRSLRELAQSMSAETKSLK